jgi:hypothetical protein
MSTGIALRRPRAHALALCLAGATALVSPARTQVAATIRPLPGNAAPIFPEAASAGIPAVT